ncbi:MAG TPA: acetolactate synthase [Actinomycetota bacterium]|nr:acetolactate synthase [Actinomycetota bacterium]
MTEPVHGGAAVVAALKTFGVEHLFTLTGGHIFPILDGAHQAGMRIVDTRHEQSAAFAAEGWARLTRSLGVGAVTAGPGVTNALSALGQAQFNRAPMLCLAGRAPGFRWGQGSLQEIDHVPFVDPLAPAHTVMTTADIAAEVVRAAAAAITAPRGPRFLDFPLEALFDNVTIDLGEPSVPAPLQPQSGSIAAVAALLADAQRPVLIAGSNVWLDGAETALRELVEAAEIPAFTNGQGRGCLPADHRLCFSRSRSRAFKEADLVIVAGTPMDFRLGFGQGFAPGAKIVHLDSHPDHLAPHVELAASVGASLDATFAALAAELTATPDTKPWVEALRETEDGKRDAAQAELRSTSNPIHPMRVYGELVPLLERDAIVICDGGDFASYAGREIPSYEAGCWLDTGPFGCLGVGPGYAMAARLAHPDRQVVVMYGDGAVGFAGMEFETMVRLGLPAVCVVGNNGIWALEKYPMQALYGYDVAAELRPGIRYDKVMEAFGGRGFLVEDPDDLAPALKAAFDCGEPALVNVLTDPGVAYPRSSNLA